MLVLSRKVGSSIYIGDNICVTVISVKNNIVNIGINAPKDIAVFRDEIYLKNKGLNPNKNVKTLELSESE